MKESTTKNRIKHEAATTAQDEFNKKKNAIKNKPKQIFIGIVWSVAVFLIGIFHNNISGAISLLAASHPLAFIAIIIGLALATLCISFAIAEIFFPKWINSGIASDVQTEMVLNELRVDPEDLSCLERITPTSAQCETSTKFLSKRLNTLFSCRHISLGVDIKAANYDINKPNSRFNFNCDAARNFLSLLPKVYLRTNNAKAFSEEEKIELLEILKTHITLDDKQKAILTDNSDLIEGVCESTNLKESNQLVRLFGDFALDSTISNDDTGEFKTKRIIQLTKLAINHLKVQKILKEDGIGQILATKESKFSAEELNQANQLYSLLSSDYKPEGEHRRLLDLYGIFIKGVRPDLKSCIEVYTIVNIACNGGLREQLTTTDTFEDMNDMVNFFDSVEFCNVSFAECINMVQCFRELISPPVGYSLDHHSITSDHILHNKEIYSSKNNLSNHNKRIYEDDDDETENFHH